MLKNLSRREKVLFGILALALAGVFSFEVIWRVQFTRYQQARQDLEKAREKAAQVMSASASLAEARRAYQEASDRLNRVEFSFSNNVSGGAPLLEVGSRLEGLHLLSVFPQKVEEKESFLVLPLQISMQGSYVQVLEFIHSLENLPYATEVRSLNFSAAPGQPGQVVAELLVAFYGKKEALPTAIGGQWQVGRLDIFSPALRELVDQASQPPDRSPAAKGTDAGEAAPQPKLEQEPAPEPYNFPTH